VAGLVVGIVAFGSSSSTSSEADDVAAEAADVAHDADEAEATVEDAQATLDQLVPQTGVVAESAENLESAIDQGVTTYNAMDALFAQAVSLINAGDVEGGQALLQQEAVFEAFAQAVDGELAAVDELRATVARLEELMSDA
jgi:hypothetical protein